jgi:hypothetical protein
VPLTLRCPATRVCFASGPANTAAPPVSLADRPRSPDGAGHVRHGPLMALAPTDYSGKFIFFKNAWYRGSACRPSNSVVNLIRYRSGSLCAYARSSHSNASSNPAKRIDRRNSGRDVGGVVPKQLLQRSVSLALVLEPEIGHRRSDEALRGGGLLQKFCQRGAWAPRNRSSSSKPPYRP